MESRESSTETILPGLNRAEKIVRSYNDLFLLDDKVVKVASRPMSVLGDRLKREADFYSLVSSSKRLCLPTPYTYHPKGSVAGPEVLITRFIVGKGLDSIVDGSRGEGLRREACRMAGRNLASIHKEYRGGEFGLLGEEDNEKTFSRRLKQIHPPFIDQLRQLRLKGLDPQNLGRALKATEDELSKEENSLLHNDYHAGNLILSSDNELFTIDGECAFIGPREYDLGKALVYLNDTENIREFLRGYNSEFRIRPSVKLRRFSVLAAAELSFFTEDNRKKRLYIEGMKKALSEIN